MVKNYEAKHFFLAIGIAVLVVSPLLLIFIPSFIANSIYHVPGTWIVIVPGLSYIVYGTGCFLLGASALLLYFSKLRKLAVFIGIVITIIGILLLFHGARPHIAIGEKGISYNTPLSAEVNSYFWQNVDKINYYDVLRSEGFDKYEFIFQDGNRVQISENGFLLPYHTALFAKFRDEAIKVHWK